MTDRPTGIKTNGIGKRTTAHLNLNLTKTMAAFMKPKAQTTVPLKPAGTKSKRIIAEGYEKGWTTNQIAAAARISPGSVKVIASRIGLRRPKKPPAPVVRRIPPYAGYDRSERQWK